MTEYLHRCLIVPAAMAPLTRLLCEKMSDAGVNMFAVPLSSTGNPPPTAYISAGLIGIEFCDILPLTTFENGVPTTRPGRPAVIVAMAAEAGIVVTLEQITGLLNSVEVTNEEWPVALERRKLSKTQMQTSVS